MTDDVIEFVNLIRKSFFQCEAYPVFAIRRYQGQPRAGKIKRIECRHVPAFKPNVSKRTLQSMAFQNKVNLLLEKNPAVITGDEHLVFYDEDGERHLLPRKTWCVEIHRIIDIEMDRRGVIGIKDFEFREVILKGQSNGTNRHRSVVSG